MREVQWVCLAAGLIMAAGCAGRRPLASSDYLGAPFTARQWDAWAAGYKAALAAQAEARTPAQRTQAIDRLADLAESAPIREAREMAVRDACLLAAAAGDGATLQRLACEDGALRGLMGGK